MDLGWKHQEEIPCFTIILFFFRVENEVIEDSGTSRHGCLRSAMWSSNGIDATVAHMRRATPSNENR
uniref:Uncharacterized protein n=1 Tax=Ascaris lumbricoides TaxID=6252 RepID=A0A0M3I149_ASCLU